MRSRGGGVQRGSAGGGGGYALHLVKKKDHWEGPINNIPVMFQAKRTRKARDIAHSCGQIHRDFGIENRCLLKKTFKIDDSIYEIHISFVLCSAVFYFFRCSLPSARHDGVRFLASSSITPSSATRSPASGVATTVPTDAQQRPPLLRPPSPPRPRPAAAFPHSKSSTPFFDLFGPFRPFLSQIDPKNGPKPPQNGATQ